MYQNENGYIDLFLRIIENINNEPSEDIDIKIDTRT